MVDGRIKKFLAEVTLVGQPFVKDPETTVAKLLEKAGATVLSFQRVELGEGIEKKTENFVEEVMAQAQAQGK
jgi:elongation factor Ts